MIALRKERSGRRGGIPFRLKPAGVLLLLLLVLVALAALSLPVGNYSMSLSEAWGTLLQRLLGKLPHWWEEYSYNQLAGMGFFLENFREEEVRSRMLFQYNLPRMAGAILVGASLSSAGAVYQGIFRNPLVSPDLLGASSGAAFGGALSIFCYWGGYTGLAVSFGFGMIAVVLVYSISLLSRDNQIFTMILAGIMVSSIFHAGISVLKIFVPSDEALPGLTAWLMGAISPGFKLKHLKLLFLPVLAALTVLMLLRWKINILTAGEDEARSMGIHPALYRGLAIFAATLATSASVSICGSIGWVGLVIPHLARSLVGPDFRVLLPASMLAGGIAVLFLDNIALQWNPVMPLGALTGFIGVPFYLILLMDRRRKKL